jgi:dolichol-phosphate mannosyltransferase
MIDYLNTKTFPGIQAKKDGLTFDWDMKLLIVDGNSPDGTAKIAQESAKKYDNTFVYVEEKKEGLGAAYAKGFKYAVDKLTADFVFEMDCDFQHPPETLPSMLKAMEDGYDYVIGSRKIKGGGEPEGRDFFRTLLTEGGGFLARFILFFPFKHFFDVTDPTTGLKVTRVKGFVDQMDLSPTHFYSKKFGYKAQWLLETLDMGAKFKEVPLKFENRTSGESKFESDTSKEFLISCIKTRFYQPFVQKFLKFGVVGGFGFIINLVGLKLFNGLYKNFPWQIGVINFLANATASEFSIISNFTFNNLWTFSQDKITSINDLVSKFLTFNLSSIFGGIIVPSLIIGLGTQIFGDQYRTLFLFIGVFGFTIPYNWFVYNKFIWKKKK